MCIRDSYELVSFWSGFIDVGSIMSKYLHLNKRVMSVSYTHLDVYKRQVSDPRTADD